MNEPILREPIFAPPSDSQSKERFDATPPAHGWSVRSRLIALFHGRHRSRASSGEPSVHAA